MNEKLNKNKKAWDQAAEKFAGGTCLPAWGPFGELENENIFGDIKGEAFLEIGYGSGHSIKYLVERGAKKVYGIDISDEQKKN
ncbi:MAG: hypothetical protein Q9M91_07110 [Candidatus Dojkabacteria bacterium]|nr:hypothetical protein [Candidatus Dojkabacteria bacterium]